MNAVENSRHVPTVVVAIKIADVFNVSVDQLFKLEYDGKPSHPELPARVIVDRSPATAVEPIEVESRPEPIEKEADRQVSLADLRGLIGS